MPWSFQNIYSRCNSFSQQHIPFAINKMAEARKPLDDARSRAWDSGSALDRQFSTSDVTDGSFHSSSGLWYVFLGACALAHILQHTMS